MGFIVTAAGLLSFPQSASGSSHDAAPPTSPREVNARAINGTTVDVFWFPSIDNAGISYNIYRAEVLSWVDGGPSTWTTPVLAGTSDNDGLEQLGFQDTGLTPETDYKYWVAAVDPSGNESAWTSTSHSSPTTPEDGNTIATQITYPSSVALGGSLTINQIITCAPECVIGHHDVHFGTTMNRLPSGAGDNFISHSVFDSTLATDRTSTFTYTPSTTGNFYFMEDGHIGGTGFTRNDIGQNPHKEGMLFRIVVTNGNPLIITPSTLPGGNAGIPYSQILTALGEGNGSYTWGIYEGALPEPLVMSTNGAISGIPTFGGTFTFGVMVEDSLGVTAFQTVTLTIDGDGPAPDIIAPAAPTDLSVE